MHRVQHVQELPLVFVNALDLHVEQRAGIHVQPGLGFQLAGEPDLVGELHGAPFLLERRVVGKCLQLLEFVEVSGPAVADPFRDQFRQAVIAGRQPAPLGYAVGLVVELLGPQLREIPEQTLAQ